MSAPLTLRLEAATRTDHDRYESIAQERIDRATPLIWDILSGRPRANLLSGRTPHRGAREEKEHGEFN
jgi:hypothetical protein